MQISGDKNNQSEARKMDQSEARMAVPLDQSEAELDGVIPLDQSEARKMDQSEASYNSQSASSMVMMSYIPNFSKRSIVTVITLRTCNVSK